VRYVITGFLGGIASGAIFGLITFVFGAFLMPTVMRDIGFLKYMGICIVGLAVWGAFAHPERMKKKMELEQQAGSDPD
jgi:hypothetical protein